MYRVKEKDVSKRCYTERLRIVAQCLTRLMGRSTGAENVNNILPDPLTFPSDDFYVDFALYYCDRLRRARCWEFVVSILTNGNYADIRFAYGFAMEPVTLRGSVMQVCSAVTAVTCHHRNRRVLTSKITLIWHKETICSFFLSFTANTG
jgi:hypothetical protein